MFRDNRPTLGQLGIQLKIVLLFVAEIVFAQNGLDWTLWFTQGAVDAFFWVNHEKVRPLVETIYGTNLYTIRVFAFDAWFGNDKGHRIPI